MKFIQFMASGLIVLLIITAIPGMSAAIVFLHDPSWEAPGGYQQAYVGDPAHTGGRTWVYSNFDPTAYDALYYVIGDYDYDPGPPEEVWTFNGEGPAIGTTFNDVTRLTYDVAESDLYMGKVVWSDTILINDSSTSTNREYKARFTLQVYDEFSQPAALIEAATLKGMDHRVGGVHHITGDFSTNWQFELAPLSSLSWQAAIPFFDSLSTHPDDTLNISVTRAFYYTGCYGDYHNDGDVDGSDLRAYSINPAGVDLVDVAANFGREDCS